MGKTFSRLLPWRPSGANWSGQPVRSGADLPNTVSCLMTQPKAKVDFHHETNQAGGQLELQSSKLLPLRCRQDFLDVLNATLQRSRRHFKIGVIGYVAMLGGEIV